jgi:hypothetical protein
MRKRLLLITWLLIAVTMPAHNAALAQDKGPPALRQLAFYTVGGSAGGALLGVAIWMLDPLAPEADIRLNALSGVGIGAVLGFVFGIMQLNRQAVLPYQEPAVPDNEFGWRPLKDPTLSPDTIRYGSLSTPKDRKHLPLFSFGFRF